MKPALTPQLAHPVAIPGLQLLEIIGRGTHSVVYRAQQNQRTYAVKIQLRASSTNSDATIRFRREAAILASLHHPALARIVTVGNVQGHAYLVMDYIDGQALATAIAEGPLPESRIVSIANDIAGALIEVHHHGLIHRDIKPYNILLDKTGNATLIDFDLAMRMRGAVVDDIIGTLAYSAPEQTGMLKRPVDGRTDLYALGVVLFECATGCLPFLADDVAELVRQHAVQPPANVRAINRDISPALAAIIAKLLAKDPDDRYQTAAALLTDMQQLNMFNNALAVAQPIVLGAHTVEQHQRGSVLIGRDHELKQILSSFTSAVAGQGNIVLVAGEAGSGKSCFINEFSNRVRNTPVFLLHGTCTQTALQPFAPLQKAIDDWLAASEQQPLPQRQAVEHQVRAAAGAFGPLLKWFTPRLATVLADIPELDDTTNTHDKFSMAVAEFILGLGTSTHPLVLMLDDIQWLDDASEQVLTLIVDRIRAAPILVVATARNDSAYVPRVQRLTGYFEKVLSAWLELRPLDESAAATLIAHQLGGHALAPKIARQITFRSKGNPFAIGEYVRTLLDTGLLRPVWDRWEIDQADLNQLQLPTDVLQLLLERIDGLAPQTDQVLSMAAVWGVHFPVSLLPALCAIELTVLHDALYEAMYLHLVERVTAQEYTFVHERVREAFLARLNDTQRRTLHRRIAQVLETGDTDGVHVYALAHHHTLGADQTQQRRVFEANLRAGIKAFESYAPQEALTFLENAQQAAQAAGLAPHAQLETMLGTVCAQIGQLANAIDHFETALTLIHDSVQRAQLYIQLGRIHAAGFDLNRAWQAVERAFAEVGHAQPRRSVTQLVTGAFYALRFMLLERRADVTTVLAPEQQVRYKLLVDLYQLASLIVLLDQRDGLVLLPLLPRLFYTARRLGPSRQLVYAYDNCAITLTLLRRPKAAERYVQRAMRMAEQLNDPISLAHSHLFQGLVKHFNGAPREAEVLSKRCFVEHGDWLEAQDYLTGMADLTWNLMLRGYCREARAWNQRALDKVERAHQHTELLRSLPHLYSFAGALNMILGRTIEAQEAFHRAEKVAAEMPDERGRQTSLLEHTLISLLEQQELGSRLDNVLQEYQQLNLRLNGTAFYPGSFYVFQAYARLAQYLAAPAAEQAVRWSYFTQALQQLKGTIQHPTLHCHLLILDGARLRLTGQSKLALAQLAAAEEIARHVDSPWAHFEIARQRAHVLIDQRNRPSALRELEQALRLASEHGWTNRAKQLQLEFQIDSRTTSTSRLLATSESPASNTLNLKLQRHLDALLQVSLASTTVLDPDQQARVVLDEVVRLLGAERAFLFVCQPDSTTLELRAGRDRQGQDLTYLTGYSTTVVEQVRHTHQPLVLNGTDEGLILGSQSIIRHNLRSILATPMLLRNRFVGVVYLDSRIAKGVFTLDDIDILQALANQIAVVLETARVAQVEIHLRAEQEKRKLAETMRDIAHVLSSTLDLDQVLDRLLQSLAQFVSYTSAAVLLSRGEALHVVAARGFANDAAVRKLSVPLSHDALFSEIVRTQRPLVLSDAQRDPRFHSYAGTTYVRSWISVPLIAHGTTVGMLTIDNHEPGVYTAQEAELIFGLASQAGVAIENARLFGEMQHMAITDELTGTHNRRQFFVLAEHEWSRAQRFKHSICVIMVDVDRFKQVNDTYGHAVGDQVLQIVADRCQRNIRTVDILGRYGGEEFAILLPDTELATALEIAERLRLRVQNESIMTSHGLVKVTISLGVAAVEKQYTSLAALLDRADAALYTAKAGGRNQVVAQ